MPHPAPGCKLRDRIVAQLGSAYAHNAKRSIGRQLEHNQAGGYSRTSECSGEDICAVVCDVTPAVRLAETVFRTVSQFGCSIFRA